MSLRFSMVLSPRRIILSQSTTWFRDWHTEFIKVCVFHRRFIVLWNGLHEWGPARRRNVGLPLCGGTNYILNVLIKIKCTFWQWLMLYNNQLLNDPALQHGSTIIKGKKYEWERAGVLHYSLWCTLQTDKETAVWRSSQILAVNVRRVEEKEEKTGTKTVLLIHHHMLTIWFSQSSASMTKDLWRISTERSKVMNPRSLRSLGPVKSSTFFLQR